MTGWKPSGCNHPLAKRAIKLDPPVTLSTPRTADCVKLGLLDATPKRELLTQIAKMEAVRHLAGKPGDYHTKQAYRRYPYGRSTASLGTLKNKVIPRLYFSKEVPIENRTFLPYNVTLRYDYESRFDFGTGPMAADEENRIIHGWTTEMQEMADILWSDMKKDNNYRSLCRHGDKFNHVSIHLYRQGNEIKDHEDRRRNRRNSMKERTPVAVLTIGDSRNLSFRRTYQANGKKVVEERATSEFELEESTVFILHPDDEVPKCRRLGHGKRVKDAWFVHRVNTGKEKNFFSVAFIFRCLETTAIIDSTTDRVVPPIPMTAKEKTRQEERAAIREMDSKYDSEFRKNVAAVQQEWIRLMGVHGWV